MIPYKAILIRDETVDELKKKFPALSFNKAITKLVNEYKK